MSHLLLRRPAAATTAAEAAAAAGRDDDEDCDAVYAPIDDDNADSKLSKSGRPSDRRSPELVVDDELYQSGCGATAPVVSWYFFAHRAGGTRRDRERDVGGVQVLAGGEVEPGLGRVGGQQTVETACLRPQLATRRGAAGADAVGPRPHREGEEHRERQTPHGDREAPAEEAAHREDRGERVGGARPRVPSCA